MATSNLKMKIISAVTATALFATSATVTAFAANAENIGAAAGQAANGGVVSEATYNSAAGSSFELAEKTELEELYIQSLFYGDISVPFKDYGSKKLSGKALEIYDFLKAKISAVAAGEETRTVFTYSTSSGYTEFDSMKADMRAAFRCLLVDAPQDFYWFDKTQGYNASLSSLGSTYTAEFRFAVSEDYAASNSEVLDGFKVQVDPAKMNAARTSVDKAQEIAKKYEDNTVSEKIKGFRNEICDLVTYNDDAADDNKKTPYGDPWQLVYVFDGNPDTNVVCEGYSKAFQYLCDLSGIECYTVTGTMGGGQGAGPHMWNIVVLDDNYLVDITNCDTGTIGADDKLLLKGASESTDKGCSFSNLGMKYVYDDDTTALYDTANILKVATVDYDPSKYEHVHEPSAEWFSDETGHWHKCSKCDDKVNFAAHENGDPVRENEVPATCEKEGSYEEVISCKVCEYEISRTEKTIEKLPHTPGEPVKENEKPATCTEEGSYDEVVYCTVCNGEISRKTVPVEKLPHTEAEPVRENVKEATCTEDGSYDEVVRCSVCGEVIKSETVVVPAAGHDFSDEWTSDDENHWQECKACGEKVGVAAHIKDHGKVTVTPTETEEGVRTYYCIVCGRILEEETIEVLEENHQHDPSIINSDNENHWKECRCGVIDEESVAPHTSDTKDEVITESTCTVHGLKYVITFCGECGRELGRTQEPLELAPHSFTNYVSDNNATCTEDGTKTAKCDNCDATDTVEDLGSATGHDFGNWVITVDPTMTEEGAAERVCKNDKTHKETVQVPPLSDTTVWSEGARVEPTPFVDGSQEYISEYGTVTVILPKTGGGNDDPDDPYDPPFIGGGSTSGNFTDPGAETTTTTTEAAAEPETTTEAATEPVSGSEESSETTAAEIVPSETGDSSDGSGSDTTALPGIPDNTSASDTGAVKAEIKTPAEDLANSILSEDEIEQVKNGAESEIVLKVDTANETVPEEDKAVVVEALASLDGYTVGQYLNIELYKVIGGSSRQVAETNIPVAVVIDIPAPLLANGRVFAVVRVHNGQAQVLNDTDNDPGTITIETDLFSTYAIVYRDDQTDKDGNPGTGVSSNTSAMACAFAAELLLSVLVFFTMNKTWQKKAKK